MSDLVRWLDEPAAANTAATGGKGANLARLVALGAPVPPGFVITTDAYRAAMAANRLDEAAPDRLHDALAAAKLPVDLESAIRAALERLENGAVAVRSSATSEDLEAASFAGQHDTFLDVRGAKAVFEAVRGCWASLWSERAVDYRTRRGWTGDVAMAVVVQAMVAAEWAGVLFTVDPVTGDPKRMVVEAVAGLGEALVSGATTGRRVVVDRATGKVVEGATDVPPDAIRELAGWGRRIEDAFGGPQDIEWAQAAGRTYLVQARAMTALPATPATPAASRRFGRLQRAMAPNVREHVPVAPYPFDLSIFFRPLWERLWATLPRLGLRTPPIDEVFVEIADGVVQVVPPRIRPSPRILGLPVLLARALRVRPKAWREQAQALAADARRLEEREVAGWSDGELLAGVRELSARQVDLAPGRFAAFPRGLLATAALGFVVRRAVGRRQAPEVERNLFAGVPSVTGAANRELASIAAAIQADPGLRDTFATREPGELANRLTEISGGREIASRITGFLDRYGDRETTLPSAAFPAWRDEPALVYGLLKALVAGSAATAAVDDADRAERAKAEVERHLRRGWFGLKGLLFRPMLARALPAARAFVTYREDSHYELFAPFAVIRLLALELGGRLAARGELDAADDVFFLRLSELEGAVPTGELREIARRRRDARHALDGRETTVPAELLAATGPELEGTPVSAGRAVGAARIVRGEGDFARLGAGEVLVAPYTNPTWTPLFAIAAAVVVEAGGAASHAAIVAREYGIPGVMGVAGATRRLHDGDQVVVDGSRGTVGVLSTVGPTPRS